MHEFVLGASLGFGAGVAPGPLLAVLLSTTLRGGVRAGAKVAFAPIVTDLPIVVLALTVLAALPERAPSVLALAGAAFVGVLAVETYRSARRATLDAEPGEENGVLLRAALVNLLNPHPWLFWITVGAPLLLTAWTTGPLNAAALLLGFYGVFVLSKLTLAALVSQARGHLTESRYRNLLKATSALLLATGAALVWEFLPGLL
ncbi:LysE family translocator [Actinocorallia longicatena]|uniref:LysE family translocator n=1 Tax=Actinocorallia longicatena TaxID=111803 RepID=A0ABP6QI84_9ACTN